MIVTLSDLSPCSYHELAIFLLSPAQLGRSVIGTLVVTWQLWWSPGIKLGSTHHTYESHNPIQSPVWLIIAYVIGRLEPTGHPSFPHCNYTETSIQHHRLWISLRQSSHYSANKLQNVQVFFAINTVPAVLKKIPVPVFLIMQIKFSSFFSLPPILCRSNLQMFEKFPSNHLMFTEELPLG